MSELETTSEVESAPTLTEYQIAAQHALDVVKKVTSVEGSRLRSFRIEEINKPTRAGSKSPATWEVTVSFLDPDEEVSPTFVQAARRPRSYRQVVLNHEFGFLGLKMVK